MAELTAVQEGFSAGELSVNMRGQFNNQLYYRGSSRQENFISTPQGPAFYRPGTTMVQMTRGGEKAFLIPFVFSESESYMLEFTGFVMRIHQEDGLVWASGQTLTTITPGAQTQINKNAHGLSNGNSIQFQTLLGDFEFLNRGVYRVSDVTANNFKIKDEFGNYIDSTGLTFTSNAPNDRVNLVMEVATPYASFNDLSRIKHAQVGKIMYLAHPSYAPQKITRVSATSWTGGGFSITGATLTTAGNRPAAVALHEQRMWFAGTDNDPQKVWGSKVQDLENFTVGVNDTDGLTFLLVSKSANQIHWLESSEKFLSIGTLGGNQKLYGATEDEAITPTSVNNRILDSLGSSSVSPVMKDKRLVFCQQGNRRVRALEFELASEGYEPIDLNLLSEDMNIEGVVQLAIQEGPPDLIWAVKNNGQATACSINFRENVFGWHRHLNLNGNFKSVASIPRVDRGSRVWFCVERETDGEARHFIEYLNDRQDFPVFEDYYTGDKDTDERNYLDALYESQKRAIHIDGASSYDGSLFGFVENITLTLSAVSGEGVIVTASGDTFEASDVGREIWGYGRGMGTIVAYTSPTQVEIDITSDFLTDDLIPTQWYLTASEISGLEYYEGQTVQVITDGGDHQDCVVENGSITLDYQSSFVHVGYGYRGIVRGMDLEAQGLNGPLASRNKSVGRLGLKLINSLGVKAGTDPYRLEAIRFRRSNGIASRTTPLFTGMLSFPLPDSHGRDKQVMIVQEKGFPCTVQLIVPDLEVSGG